MTEEDEVAHLQNMLDDDDRYSWMIERDSEIVGNIELNEIAELSHKYGVTAGGILYTDWRSEKLGSRPWELRQASSLQLGVF